MITVQEIFNIVDLFTSQSTINFYENIFDNLDLSFIPEFIESEYSKNPAHLCTGLSIMQKKGLEPS